MTRRDDNGRVFIGVDLAARADIGCVVVRLPDGRFIGVRSAESKPPSGSAALAKKDGMR